MVLPFNLAGQLVVNSRKSLSWGRLVNATISGANFEFCCVPSEFFWFFLVFWLNCVFG